MFNRQKIISKLETLVKKYFNDKELRLKFINLKRDTFNNRDLPNFVKKNIVFLKKYKLFNFYKIYDNTTYNKLKLYYSNYCKKFYYDFNYAIINDVKLQQSIAISVNNINNSQVLKLLNINNIRDEIFLLSKKERDLSILFNSFLIRSSFKTVPLLYFAGCNFINNDIKYRKNRYISVDRNTIIKLVSNIILKNSLFNICYFSFNKFNIYLKNKIIFFDKNKSTLNELNLSNKLINNILDYIKNTGIVFYEDLKKFCDIGSLNEILSFLISHNIINIVYKNLNDNSQWFPKFAKYILNNDSNNNFSFLKNYIFILKKIKNYNLNYFQTKNMLEATKVESKSIFIDYNIDYNYKNVNNNKLVNLNTELRTWMMLTTQLSWKNVENIFFCELYKKYFNNNNLNFIDFFNKYFFEIKNNPNLIKINTLASIKKIIQLRKQLSNIFYSTDYYNEEIQLSEENLNFLEPTKSNVQPLSLSSFVLPLYTNNKLSNFIVPDGRYNMGYYKYISRFTNCLDKNSKEKIIQDLENDDIFKEYILAKIDCDDLFNGNINDLVLSNSIEIKSIFDRNLKNNINLDNVFVSPINNNLVLKFKNKTLIPIDFGFYDIRKTHPVKATLNVFNLSGGYSIDMFLKDEVKLYKKIPRFKFKTFYLMRKKIIFNQTFLSNYFKSKICNLNNSFDLLRIFLLFCKEFSIENKFFIKIYLKQYVHTINIFNNNNKIPSILSNYTDSKFFDISNPICNYELFKFITKIISLDQDILYIVFEEVLPNEKNFVKLNNSNKEIEILITNNFGSSNE